MENFFKSWLNFDNMITPRIITVIYWILMVVTVIVGFIGLFKSFLAGILIIIFGVIGVRISCELVMLSFNIYKSVKIISDRVEKDSAEKGN